MPPIVLMAASVVFPMILKYVVLIAVCSFVVAILYMINPYNGFAQERRSFHRTVCRRESNH